MQDAPPHGKHLRTGRVSLPGQVYLVTMVTRSREKTFSGFHEASVAARSLYDSSIVPRAHTLAYVVMPDHVHWMIQLGSVATLSTTVRLYRARVSVLLGRSIWQPGFHDHALRAEEDVAEVARYVVANPLRAGLCEKIGQHPYWNAVWL